MSRKDLPLPPRDKDQRGSLTFAQPQPGPGNSLVRLAERDEGDEVGVLIGGSLEHSASPGALLCKAIGGQL